MNAGDRRAPHRKIDRRFLALVQRGSGLHLRLHSADLFVRQPRRVRGTRCDRQLLRGRHAEGNVADLCRWGGVERAVGPAQGQRAAVERVHSDPLPLVRRLVRELEHGEGLGERLRRCLRFQRHGQLVARRAVEQALQALVRLLPADLDDVAR